jgi:cyclic-di-GMP phosphodiesterase TipF (flagellum assembly factor)
MLRIGAIFIAVCMVLIAASLGAVLYLGFKFDAQSAALAALAALVGMLLFQSISNRLRDRSELGDQIADLSRGTADLARQVAEVSRRLNSLEGSVTSTVNRARSMVDPLAAELGELGGLVRQLAETVAAHDATLQHRGLSLVQPALIKPQAEEPVPAGPIGFSANDAAAGARMFRGLTREEIGELVARAIEDNRIDLYLQPIVTLPQRKVRHYEALSRLRGEDGEIIPAGDFLEYAESAGLVPRLDNLLLFRCVQVTRRLQLKNRDVGLFCNISALTLSDPTYFRQLLDFMDANRALAPALTLEFSQSAYRSFGPIEQESLSALAERGFRFSMDHVVDLRMEPKDLADHAFRCLKVPAALLLNPATSAQSDIHPADLADLLARSGIDLIAERVENETMVLDLLDFDVRFGQGFLFSPPRPVRAEALQTTAGDGGAAETAADPSGVLAAVRAAS